MALTMPIQHIYLQLADPFTTADFTDITPLVKQWNGVVRGRQHELQLFQPGQVSLTIESNFNQGRFNPWNTNSPFYNMLSPNDAVPLVSNGTWGSAVHATLGTFPQTSPAQLDVEPYALKITCNGTSPSSITNSTTAYAVVAGQQYTAMASFMTSVTSRACSVGIQWYSATGSLISTSTSSTINDGSGGWTKAMIQGATAPAGAVTAAIILTITSAASSEVHWAGRIGLFNYSGNVPNTAWGPGQRGLVPGRTMYCTATWANTTYPIWYMYTSNFTPQYGKTKSEQVINCADGMALLSLGDLSTSTYYVQALADGAQSFWQCNDAIGASQAADSGPLGNPLTATYVSFGQASPMLTSDNTVALMGPNGTLTSTAPINPGTGPGSLEIFFQMPLQSTASSAPGAVFLFSLASAVANNGYIEFIPSSNNLVITAATGSAAQITVNAPQLDNGLWHHLVVTWTANTGGTMQVFLDGVTVATLGSVLFTSMFATGANFRFGSQVQFGNNYPFNGQFGNIAYYNTRLTLAQAQNHYDQLTVGYQVGYSGTVISSLLTAIGWPTSLQNIATGVSQVQSATSSLTQTSSLSYFQSIESTELGALFVDPSGNLTFYDRHYIITATASTISNGTFSNQLNAPGAYRYLPGLVPAMDDTDLWNDVPAQRNGGVLQRAQSALSILYYGRRSLTGYTGELQTTDSEVLYQAQWLISQYAQPYTRCRSIILSSVTGAGANLPQMLGRGIFDQITMEWLPIDGSTVYFNQPSLIESIEHTVTQSEWRTTWGLSPAEIQKQYMVLNSATNGQLSGSNLATVQSSGDSSGNSNNGTVHGGVVPSTSSPVLNDYSATFDGSSGYIEAAAPIVPAGTWSIAIWFNTQTNSNPAGLFANDNPSSSHTGVRCYQNGTSGGVGILVGGGGTWSQIFSSTPSVGAWHHLVATSNGTTIQLYLDGVSQGTAAQASAIGVDNLYVGTQALAGGGYWLGNLAQFAVFSSHLSSAQVSALYAASSTTYDSLLLSYSPTLWWKLSNNIANCLAY